MMERTEVWTFFRRALYVYLVMPTVGRGFILFKIS